MPKGNKKKNESKPKKNKSVRGYSERVVSPSRNTPPHLLGTLADIAEGVLPLTPLAPFAPLIKPLRSVLGFDERVVSSAATPLLGGTSTDGGTVVRTMSAPVAFARNQLKTGYHAIQIGEDAQRMWVCDQVDIVQTKNVTGAFNGANFELFPCNSSLFANFYAQFEDWERWRPLHARLHYVHFANTSEVASVVLAGNCDDNSGELASVFSTFITMGSLECSAIGNAYEDLGLDITFPAWDQGTWLYNDTADGTDSRLNGAGYVGWGCEQNASVSKGIGYFYVELLFDVCARRKPYAGAGLYTRLMRSLSGVPEDERPRYLQWSRDQMYLEMLREFERLKNASSRVVQQPKMIQKFHEDSTSQSETSLTSRSPIPSAAARPSFK